MTYEEVYKDWDFLFNKIGMAEDMTGGYVDSEDLEALLKKPTKVTAKMCLWRQIDYWFQAGLDSSSGHEGKTIDDLIEEYPEIEVIADKYGCDLSLCPQPFMKY